MHHHRHHNCNRPSLILAQQSAARTTKCTVCHSKLPFPERGPLVLPTPSNRTAAAAKRQRHYRRLQIYSSDGGSAPTVLALGTARPPVLAHGRARPHCHMAFIIIISSLLHVQKLQWNIPRSLECRRPGCDAGFCGAINTDFDHKAFDLFVLVAKYFHFW